MQCVIFRTGTISTVRFRVKYHDCEKSGARLELQLPDIFPGNLSRVSSAKRSKETKSHGEESASATSEDDARDEQWRGNKTTRQIIYWTGQKVCEVLRINKPGSTALDQAASEMRGGSRGKTSATSFFVHSRLFLFVELPVPSHYWKLAPGKRPKRKCLHWTGLRMICSLKLWNTHAAISIGKTVTIALYLKTGNWSTVYSKSTI